MWTPFWPCGRTHARVEALLPSMWTPALQPSACGGCSELLTLPMSSTAAPGGEFPSPAATCGVCHASAFPLPSWGPLPGSLFNLPTGKFSLVVDGCVDLTVS